MKDYYIILGIQITASHEVVKKAYRTLSKKYHPDVNPNGGEVFKNINEANSVLSDPEKRKIYDLKHQSVFGSNQSNSKTQTKPKAKSNFNSVHSNFKGNTQSQSTIIVNGVKINVNGNNTYTSVTVVNGKVTIETRNN